MNDLAEAGLAKGPRAARWAAAQRWGEAARALLSRLRQPRAASFALCALSLLCWLCWRFQPFYRVGMASNDQLQFALQGTSDFWGWVYHHASAQGRVYFLLNKIVDLWLAARPEGWRIHAFNLLIFALSAPCCALALFRTGLERLLYTWLFASVCWAGYHHLPPAAYPSVNHLPFLLWPLAAWAARRASQRQSDGGWGLLAGFGALAFLALFQYEPVAGLSLCVFGWIVYDTPLPRLRRRLGLALGVAVLAYAAVYLGWRALYPTSYDGLQVGSRSPWVVLRVVVAYSLGALPFSEAYLDTPLLRFGDREVGDTYLRYPAEGVLPPAASALALTALGLAGLLGLLALRRGQPAAEGSAHGAAAVRRRALGLLLLVPVMLLAINGPLGLSFKYQAWVRDWDETYLTSQLALYPLLVPGTLLLAASFRRPRWRGLPLLFLPLALGVCALSLPVRGHNQHITTQQRANLARWEGVAALAAYARHIEQPLLVMPDLYYSVYLGEENWTEYWGRYVQQRFGGWLSFRPGPPAQGDDFALVRLHRFDDGRLRALSVQTPSYLAVVARRANAPLAVVADNGQAAALDWQSEAEVLQRSGYSAVTLLQPGALLGPRRRIELVWHWPETSLLRNPPQQGR